MERNKHLLVLSDDEQRVIVNCLKNCRDTLSENDRLVSEIDQLILKVIDAPIKKGRRINHDGR